MYAGAVLGLLIGFGGGAGNAFFAEAGRSQTEAVSVLPPSPDRTPAGLASRTSDAAATPTTVPVNKPVSSASSGSAGPPGASETCGSPSGRLVRFRVLVEDGLPTSPATYVKDLLSVLCDERSWIRSGEVRFRYDPKGPLLIGLRKPASAEKRCMELIGLSVNSYYSCASSREIVLNSDRWFKGSDHWPGSVAHYRQMLVNHEVGHTLGQHHRGCAKDGGLAPVMMQQSKGLTTDGRTCKPNPWPRPYELNAL